ncbi:MAG: hypothetical protein IV112_00300 [Methyloversatilis discipulorum]|uniref:hypothetical protein n=1 Tax=Methyloversatilis discipulorum TaxID=1119528 RepID=UPI0026E9FCEB|nr:hypothetical protein [Methyloversatilis discipulorum]MBT9515098.1 hypothetical protein [Methyloversatilis discipulorum]
MTAYEFVAAWKREKEQMLRLFMGDEGQSAVAAHVRSMTLSDEQLCQLRLAFDGALTDVMYTILLALEGEGSIGGIQQIYQLTAQDGTVVTGGIEEEAWRQFHGAS